MRLRDASRSLRGGARPAVLSREVLLVLGVSLGASAVYHADTQRWDQAFR